MHEINLSPFRASPDKTNNFDIDLVILSLVRIDGGKTESSIVTATAKINDASAKKHAVVLDYCRKIIDESLNGLQLPGGEEKREHIREYLTS